MAHTKADHAVYRESNKLIDTVHLGTKTQCQKELAIREKSAKRAGCYVERTPQDCIEIGSGEILAGNIRDVSFVLYVAPWCG